MRTWASLARQAWPQYVALAALALLLAASDSLRPRRSPMYGGSDREVSCRAPLAMRSARLPPVTAGAGTSSACAGRACSGRSCACASHPPAVLALLLPNPGRGGARLERAAADGGAAAGCPGHHAPAGLGARGGGARHGAGPAGQRGRRGPGCKPAQDAGAWLSEARCADQQACQRRTGAGGHACSVGLPAALTSRWRAARACRLPAHAPTMCAAAGRTRRPPSPQPACRSARLACQTAGWTRACAPSHRVGLHIVATGGAMRWCRRRSCRRCQRSYAPCCSPCSSATDSALLLLHPRRARHVVRRRPRLPLALAVGLAAGRRRRRRAAGAAAAGPAAAGGGAGGGGAARGGRQVSAGGAGLPLMQSPAAAWLGLLVSCI